MNWKVVFAVIAVGATSVFAEKVDLKDELTKVGAWKLNKIWTMEKGDLTGSAKGNSFLFMKKKLTLTEMEFEAEITVIKVEGTNWKVAGIVLYKSPTEYWQLALIESPDKGKNAKLRFVEMKCKQGKIWGAESKLKRLVIKGFKWEYGKTYELKLKLSPGRIDGFVYAEEDDDKVLAHIAYELKDGAVKTGMPVLRCMGFKATFSDIEVEGK